MNPFDSYMVIHSGRSFWQARYRSGKVLSEWTTGTNILTPFNLLPNIKNGDTSRWEETPKKDMIGLRILCPNGMAGELESPEDYKFFQLKSGHFDVVHGGNRSIAVHIIGMVQDADGNCLCRAWDYRTKQLLRFTDNIYNMQFEHIGQLNIAVQGMKV